MGIFKQPGNALLRLLILIGMLTLPAIVLAQQTSDDMDKFRGSGAARNLDLTRDELKLLTLPLPGPDLADLAEVWQSHLQDSIQASVWLNLELENADSTEVSAIREKILDTATGLNSTLGKYQTVLSEWQRKGADPDALAIHVKYAAAVTSELFQVTDTRTLLRMATTWLFSIDGGLGFLVKAGVGLLAFVCIVLVARFVRNAVGRAVEHIPTISNLLKTFIMKSVYWLTLAIGMVVIFAFAGFNVSPVFAVFGGVSFILAFALQDTLGNLASGLMIMVIKPFDTGDLIQVSGISGIVDNVSIIATTIRTFDNQIIVVPNSKVWGDVITNVNSAPNRRVDLVFSIAYSDNAPQAIDILTKLIKQNKLCLSDPAPSIFVGELADSSVNIFCRPWVKTADYWTVYWGMLSQAKDQFDAEGVSIPFPQRDVHLHQVTEQKDS